MKCSLLAVSVLLVVSGCAQSHQRTADQDNAAPLYLTAYAEIESDLRGYGTEDYDVYFFQLTSTAPGYFDAEQNGELIDQVAQSLGWVRHGEAMGRCDWPVQDWEQPPYRIMPHLGIIKNLGRVMVVSGLVKNARGDLAGSTDDLLVALRMAPDAASDEVVISILVQYYMDRIAREALALQLEQYDRAGLEALRDRLDDLPPPTPIVAGLHTDRVMYGDWLRDIYRQQGVEIAVAEFNELYDSSQLTSSLMGAGPADRGGAEFYVMDEAEPSGRIDNASPEQFAQWLDELDAYFERAETVFNAPPSRFIDLRDAFEHDVEHSSNPIVRLMISSMTYSRGVELQAQSRQGMLDAMIAYRLGGESAFDAIVDPWDGMPYERELTDEGVIVSSRMPESMIGSEAPLRMVFPAACAQPLAP